MTTRELKIEISKHKNELYTSLHDSILDFRARIVKLINTTPTGDLRNDYTDLNILFESILEQNMQLNDL